jgi:hypothetical protein
VNGNGEVMPKIVKLLDAARDGIVLPLSPNRLRQAAAKGEIPGAFQVKERGTWYLDLSVYRPSVKDLQPQRAELPLVQRHADAARAATRAADLARALRRKAR